MHFQQNAIQFGRYICYNLTDLKILTRKKMVLELRAREKYLQKYTQLATAGKKMKRCAIYKTILIAKN